MFNIYNLVSGLDDRDTIALVEAIAVKLPVFSTAKKLMLDTLDELKSERQAKVVLSIEITKDEYELAIADRKVDAIKALRARRTDLCLSDCMERINAAINSHRDEQADNVRLATSEERFGPYTAKKEYVEVGPGHWRPKQ